MRAVIRWNSTPILLSTMVSTRPWGGTCWSGREGFEGRFSNAPEGSCPFLDWLQSRQKVNPVGVALAIVRVLPTKMANGIGIRTSVFFRQAKLAQSHKLHQLSHPDRTVWFHQCQASSSFIQSNVLNNCVRCDTDAKWRWKGADLKTRFYSLGLKNAFLSPATSKVPITTVRTTGKRAFSTPPEYKFIYILSHVKYK